MGSAAICAKTKPKNIANRNNEYQIFSKNLDDYLKSGRNEILTTKTNKERNNPLSVTNYNNNLGNEFDNADEIYENKDNIVSQPKPAATLKIEEKEKFNLFLKTGKLTASNLTETLNTDNLLKISLELLSGNQQTKIKSINHINLFNCVTFPRILNDINLKDSVHLIETTEISEKTNFRIIYNKNMQDIMNNLFFPEEFKMQQRNTINFTSHSISFRDLPVPLTQLNVTTSNINGNPGQMMEISNLNNLNFNTQPNDDLIVKRRASNFTNFNRKIKNYILETDKIISCDNDSSSNNLGSINMKKKESIASKTLKQLYDKVFRHNSIKKLEFQPRMSQITSSNSINTSYRKSISPNLDPLKKNSIFFKHNNNISFANNLPKTTLYTIEDCKYDYNNASEIYENCNTNPNNLPKNSERKNRQLIDNKFARKLYYSLEVRSRILEMKEKEKELMMRSLSDLEEEYNQLQEEINPIFNIKNAIDESNFDNEIEDSKRNMKYLNTNERNNRNQNNKNSKKEPLFEINIKDLIKETINERILTENNKDKASEKSKIIKFKNIINNININIQTNTEGNYSTIYKKKPKTNSNDNVKENFIINASSEFINSIETFTKINNTNYDKRISSKVISLKKNDKAKNLNINHYKKNLIGYSNNSLKNKYSNISSSKKIDSSEAEKRRKPNNKTLDLNNNNNIKIKTYFNKAKDANANRKNNNKSKISSYNCENIFSNIVIESPIIGNNNSIGDFNINKTTSINNLENLNIPSISLQERNSFTNNNLNEMNSLITNNNNIDSINNANVETHYPNMNIDKKRAFTLQKCASNSLISESKSFTESDLVSSFDSKELTTLQDESQSVENNTNFKFNKSKDNILTQGNSQEILKIGNSNNRKYVSFNNNINNGNIALNLNENYLNVPEKKELKFNIQKRNTMVVSIPKFNISK